MPSVYSSNYDDLLLRGKEEERPWNIVDVIREHCSIDERLLDVGCGTCKKTLPLAASVSEMWGLEPSTEMIEVGRKLALDDGIENVGLVEGVASELPFVDGYFSVATSLLAPHDVSELHRVLKPGGTAIVEKIGERDKANIKEVFGDDEHGPRGQFLLPEGKRQEALRRDFQALFRNVEVRSGKWGTILSREGLELLCKTTNSIRNFDPEKDSDVLERVYKACSVEGEVHTQQHRILIIATK